MEFVSAFPSLKHGEQHLHGGSGGNAEPGKGREEHKLQILDLAESRLSLLEISLELQFIVEKSIHIILPSNPPGRQRGRSNGQLLPSLHQSL